MSLVNQLEGVDLSGTFAPIYWGFVISLLLGGITIVQAYIYFPRAKDKIGIQLTAACMLVLDLVSSFLVAYSIYYYLIPRFGSLIPLNSVTPELSAECLVSTAITLISQMYFVYQLISVKRLGKGSWIVICSIAGLAVLAFVGGVACVATMYIFQHGVLSNRNNTFSVFFGVAKGFGAATDILATIAMCVFLTSSKTGMKQTNSMLKALVQFIIHRGALVTLIQTLLLITFYAIPRSLVWLAFHVNVTKLYANTFFAMLNGREHLKERHLGISTNISSTHFAAVRDNTKTAVDQDEHYNMQQMEEQNDNTTSMNMPRITKTVVIADI